MKRLIASSVVAAVALVVAAPAQPAAPSNAKLARQIKTLQKQVKTLKKQVKEAGPARGRRVRLCGLRDRGDRRRPPGNLDRHRRGIDEPIFGPQVPVNDYGVCSLFEFTRAPTQMPPNVSVFNSLLALFSP